MDKHNELENLLEEALPRSRRPAAEIMVVPPRSGSGTRAERARSGRRRWVTCLKSRPDLRRFTRSLPVL